MAESTHQAIEALKAVPGLFVSFVSDRPGTRVRVTLQGVSATGTVIASTTNVWVELDGTGTRVWVPRTLLSAAE